MCVIHCTRINLLVHGDAPFTDVTSLVSLSNWKCLLSKKLSFKKNAQARHEEVLEEPPIGAKSARSGGGPPPAEM